MNRYDLLDRANERAKEQHVTLENDRGLGVPVRWFAGARMEFPRAQTDYGSVEISWALLERIANGETSRILG